MLYQTGGTIIAGQLALIHGWAINLGGVSIYYNSFNYSNAYKSDFIRDFIMHPATTAEDFACTQVSSEYLFMNSINRSLTTKYIVDLTLSIKLLRIETNVTRAMIVDLDAHQGKFINRNNVTMERQLISLLPY
jgi:hypothetical protein